jgi:hypothetical protein
MSRCRNPCEQRVELILQILLECFTDAGIEEESGHPVSRMEMFLSVFAS